MGDGHEFTFGLGAVARPGGHEFGAKGDVGALGPERVVVGSKIWSTDGADLRVVKPAHELCHPIQRRHGVVVGEQHEVVVHLLKCEVAGVRSVS